MWRRYKMSNVDNEYYKRLMKLDKCELAEKVMNLESQNNEYSNENYVLGRENEQLRKENAKLKSGEFVLPEVAKQSFEMRDKVLRIYEEKLEMYKRALELACERLQREDVYITQTQVKYYLEQAKNEINKENIFDDI